MSNSGEDIPAIYWEQPTTGGDVDGLWGLLADHRIETGSIDKVSTLPKIVCQPIHPFLPVVLFQLPHQSSWTVAQCPVSEQPNDTDVTSIPEKHIVAVIICMFIREGNFSCLSLHNKHPLDYFTHLRVRISRNIFWCGRSSWSRTVWLVDR